MSDMVYIYAILLNTHERAVPIDKIKVILNTLKDWALFGATNWLVATTLNQNEIYERVRAILDPRDDIWVVELNMLRHQGWVNNIVIEWIHRDHNGRPGI